MSRQTIQPTEGPMRNSERGQGEAGLVLGIGFVGIALIGLVVLGMWGCPQYAVYQASVQVQEQNLVGQGELARAEQNRQIAIAQSKAKAEAAMYEAAADTMRAHGISRSNAIIGERLIGDAGERYLRYLWIEGIKENGHVIYVPTEAGLPILEAGKRKP